MKAIITVLKKDLVSNENLIHQLSDLCFSVEEKTDSFRFSLKPMANMTFICLLLNDEIPYTLAIENSVQEKSVKVAKKRSKA